MKSILIILLLISGSCFGQQYYNYGTIKIDTALPERIKVKIMKIKYDQPITKVWMKTIKRPRIKYFTKCDCIISYRKKDIVWINKP